MHNYKSANTYQIKENFYNDMLQTWANINYHEPKTAKEVAAQTLWYNDLITIDKKPVQYKAWKKVGITRIIHILDKNGKIMTVKNLQNKYQFNTKQLEYNSLIHSIPKTWINMLTKHTEILDIYRPQYLM